MSLPIEETAALITKAQSGDIAARNTLVVALIPLVHAVAKSYSVSPPTSRADLIQQGTIGVMRAISRYSSEYAVRLETYAVYWIRAFIGKALQQAVDIVTSKPPNMPATISLDEVSPHTDEPRVNSLSSGSDVESEFSARQLRQQVRTEALAAISKKENGTRRDWSRRRIRCARLILRKRLLAASPETLEDIGARLRVTRERVRQVEVNLLTHLRETFTKVGLQEHLR